MAQACARENGQLFHCRKSCPCPRAVDSHPPRHLSQKAGGYFPSLFSVAAVTKKAFLTQVCPYCTSLPISGFLISALGSCKLLSSGKSRLVICKSAMVPPFSFPASCDTSSLIFQHSSMVFHPWWPCFLLVPLLGKQHLLSNTQQLLFLLKNPQRGFFFSVGENAVWYYVGEYVILCLCIPVECTVSRVNPNVNWGLGVAMISYCRSIRCKNILLDEPWE